PPPRRHGDQTVTRRSALALLASSRMFAQKRRWRAYVGTYTRGTSKGIYLFQFQPSTGALIPEGLAAATDSPSFLALHPNRKFLYAVNESASATVSAFAIDAKTGALKLLNMVPARGSSPCHLAVDKTGRCLLAANYGDGSVAAFPVLENGGLGAASDFIPHNGPNGVPP